MPRKNKSTGNETVKNVRSRSYRNTEEIDEGVISPKSQNSARS